MMLVTTDQGGKVFIEAEMNGRYGVCLDNDSLLELARTRDSSLREVRRGNESDYARQGLNMVQSNAAR